MLGRQNKKEEWERVLQNKKALYLGGYTMMQEENETKITVSTNFRRSIIDTHQSRY